MKEPTFSICIPNYNYGRYIGDTIQSVLDQTYGNFEIIVADNASTDNSLEVVRSFKDDRIRLVCNRYNIGYAPNLQRVTMYAQNEFINLLSSDDQMKPTALEEYAKAIMVLDEEARQAVVLMSEAEGFDNNDRVTRIMRKAKNSFARISLPVDDDVSERVITTRYSGHEVLSDILARLDAAGVFCSITYSRALWETVEGYNSIRTIGPDAHFMYKVLAQNPTVIYAHAPLFRYRDFLSDNRAILNLNMRYPIDQYLNTLEFGNEKFLTPMGMSPLDLQKVFLDKICLKDALSALGRGNYSFAFRLFAFCMATYPGLTLRMKKSYMLLPLLALGPFARFVARPFYAWYQHRQPPQLPLAPELAGQK